MALRHTKRTPEGDEAVKQLRHAMLSMDPELAAASAAVDADPGDAAALQRTSDLYLVRGRKVEALADMRAAVALDASRPDDTAAECGRTCRWVMWRLYTTLLAVIGATVIISALLATLAELGGLVPSPLHNAAERGDLATVTRMAGAATGPGNPAILGVPLGQHLLWQTPLGVAAFKDHVSIVSKLLDAGAAPDAGRAEGPLGWISTETPLYTVRTAVSAAETLPLSLCLTLVGLCWCADCRRRSWGTRRWSRNCWWRGAGGVPTPTTGSLQVLLVCWPRSRHWRWQPRGVTPRP